MAGIKQIKILRPERKSKSKSQPKSKWPRDTWLETTLDDSLKGYMAPPREKVFYPSTLGNPCDRYLYLAYTGQLKGKPLEANLKRIFDTGNALEHRLERYFSNMGVYINREIVVKGEYPPMSGRIDFVINHHKHGVMPIESKTINDGGFKKLSKPKEDHETQLQIYLNLGGYKIGTLFYENKNDQKIKTFLLERSDKAWNEILERCFKIMEMTIMPDNCTGLRWCDCRNI